MGKTMIGTERPKVRKLLDSIYETRRLKKIEKQIKEIKTQRKFNQKVKVASKAVKKRRIELGKPQQLDHNRPWAENPYKPKQKPKTGAKDKPK